MLWASLLLFAASASAQVQLPDFNAAEPISITAQAGNRWQAGSYEVWVLRGDCVIQQGDGRPDAARPCCGSTGPRPPNSGRTRSSPIWKATCEIAPDRRPGGGD